MRTNNKTWLRCVAVLMAAVAVPCTALAQTDALQRLLDRVEIDDMLMRYTHALDTLDADAFVSLFAPDAVFELPGGDLRQGHDAIRGIITERLGETRDVATLEHHVVTNATLEFLADDEVRYVAYWMTVVGDMQAGFTVPAMGHYDDIIVKRDGKWLIQSRKIILPGMP